MAAFTVDKVYYVPHQDLLVLCGALASGRVLPGWFVDLPREIRGPGWVPIMAVQNIPFQDGTTKLGLILSYQVVANHQLMEFSDLEGLALDLRQV